MPEDIFEDIEDTALLDKLVKVDKNALTLTIEMNDGTTISFKGPSSREMAREVVEILYTRLVEDVPSISDLREDITSLKKEILETTSRLSEIYDRFVFLSGTSTD